MPANKGGAATHAGEQQHHQDVCNSNYFAQTNTDRSNYHVSYMRSATTKTRGLHQGLVYDVNM